MKKCSLCDTLIIGNTCPNCGMRIDDGNASTTQANNARYNTTNQNYNTTNNQSYNTNSSKTLNNPEFNSSNTRQFGTSKPKKPMSRFSRTLISAGFILLFSVASEFLDGSFSEPVAPEPDYDYNQIMENIDNYNENYNDTQEDMQGILEGIDIPNLEEYETGQLYWQDEYDYMLEFSSASEYYMSYYPGTHLVGLDIPAGDYILRIEMFDEGRVPDTIILNGESLEISQDMFLTFANGDVFQFVGGHGFNLSSFNNQDLIYLDTVPKNDEFYAYSVSSEITVGNEVSANTYDVQLFAYEDAIIEINYPEGYALQDFSISLTPDDYFFDNLILPEGTVLNGDTPFDLQVSPFNVISLIS